MAIICLMAVSGAGRAAESAAFILPLQGHYRVGRYMPVRVSAQLDSADEVLSLKAVGAVTTRATASGSRLDATLPWLSYRTIHDAAWTTRGSEHPVDLPLQPLEDEQRLIGFAGADPDALARLFPGQTLVRVSLEGADPLPGAAAAWEALDGVVLDSIAAGHVSQATLATLLAGGAAVAIKTPHCPRGEWPWRQQGDYWVTRVSVAGPTSVYVPAAYTPAQGWVRGWPIGVRQRVMLIAIVFCLLATGASLWRSKWAQLGIVALCAAAAVIVVYTARAQSPMLLTAGAVEMHLPQSVQRDAWTYIAVLKESDGTMPFGRLTHPVIGYRQQPDDQRLTLDCAADGRAASFGFHLQPGQALAFVARSLTPGGAAAMPTPITPSPLTEMADKLYVLKDDRIVAERSAAILEEWPDVIVERKNVPPAAKAP